MPALGWLLNLDFAASSAEADVEPIDNSLALVVIYDVPHIEDPETYEVALDLHNAVQALNRSTKELLDTNKKVAVETSSFTVDEETGTYYLKGSAAAVQATLPLAADYVGRIIRFKSIAATFTTSIIPQGGNKLEGVTTAHNLTLYSVVTVQSDGINWWIIGN